MKWQVELTPSTVVYIFAHAFEIVNSNREELSRIEAGIVLSIKYRSKPF